MQSKTLTGEGTVLETIYGLVSFGHWIFFFTHIYIRLINYARNVPTGAVAVLGGGYSPPPPNAEDCPPNSPPNTKMLHTQKG